jgi:hypothetical protein
VDFKSFDDRIDQDGSRGGFQLVSRESPFDQETSRGGDPPGAGQVKRRGFASDAKPFGVTFGFRGMNA